jgi:hypothetical protein
MTLTTQRRVMRKFPGRSPFVILNLMEEEDVSVRSFNQSRRFPFLRVIFVMDCIAGASFTLSLLIRLLPLFHDFVFSSFMTEFTTTGAIFALIPLTFLLGVLGLVLRKVALSKKGGGELAEEAKYLRWMLLIGAYDVALPATVVLWGVFVSMMVGFSVPV